MATTKIDASIAKYMYQDIDRLRKAKVDLNSLSAILKLNNVPDEIATKLDNAYLDLSNAIVAAKLWIDDNQAGEDIPTSHKPQTLNIGTDWLDNYFTNGGEEVTT